MLGLPGLITIAALIVYLVLTANVGRARSKYSISPPAVTGNPDFERVIRVQQNMLEQLVLFLPLLWLFSYFISPLWGAGIGAIWVGSRIFYAWGYYQAAEKRILGFVISFFCNLALLVGALIGIFLSGFSS